MARVTRAELRAGSSETGSFQIARRRSRLLAAQILKIDAEGLAVGKLVEGFAVAAEVCVDLETVADIADEDEGRRLVIGGQQAHIILGLTACVEHQYVPRPLGAATPARGGLGDE